MEKKLSQRIKEQLASLRSRKKWQALAGVLSLLVLCWTVYALILPAVATTGAPDLTDKVTTATFQKSVGGVWVESDSFLSTDEVRATIEFAEVSASDLASNKMCIKLPDGLDLSNYYSGQSFDLSDSRYTGDVAGSYTLETDDEGNSYAVITFTDEYIAFINNQNSTIGGKLNFEFTWDVSDASADQTVTKEIKMGQSKKTITITKVDTDDVTSGNYSLNKSGPQTVTIDEDGNGILTYEITLKVTNGVQGSVVLTDAMDIDAAYVQFGEFTIAGESENANIKIEATDGTSANTKTLTVSAKDGDTISGGTYTITYTVTLDGLATADWTLNADNAKNTISLTDGDDTISKDTWTSIQKVNIQKSGELSTDSAGAYVMDWTILVNAGAVRNTLKGGETITDVLPNGLSISDGTTVKVKVYDTNNALVDDTRTATVSNGAISYKVPSEDAGKSYKYEITYQTVITDQSNLAIGNTDYENSATVTWDDSHSDASSATVTVSNKAIEKEFVADAGKESTADGGFALTHSWKSTITKDVSESDVYTDYRGYNTYTDAGYTLGLTKDDPVLTLSDGTVLKAGEDYELVRNDDGTLLYNDHPIVYQVKFLKGIKAPITIEYQTLCTTVAGKTSVDVLNAASVSINGETDTASDRRQIELTKDDSYDMIWKAVKNAQDGSSESSVTVDAENRTIDWEIWLNKGGKLFENAESVTVTDQIPEGQTYVEGSLKVVVWGTNEVNVTSATVENGLITVVVPKATTWAGGSDADLSGYTDLRIQYQTEVTDSAYLTGSTLTTDVKNSATVKVNGDEYTSEHTVHFTRKVIGKEGTFDPTTNTITYAVLVNPDGADLLANSDQLRVCDELTVPSTLENSYFTLAGVTLYKAEKDSNGKYVAGAYVQDMKLVSSGAGSYENGTYTYDSNSMQINAYVSDKEAYMLVYAYRINVELSETVSITNSATIYGADTEIDSTEEKREVKKSEAGGYVWSTGIPLILEKHDTDSYTTLLPGATYTLYRYSKKDNKWKEVKSYTTEDNGQVAMVGTKDQIKNNYLYKLVETSAPEGYELDEKPYYFTIQESESSSVKIPDDVEKAGYTVNFYSSSSTTQAPITIHRYDKKDDEYVEAGAVKVSKLWTDSSGNAITDETTLASMPEITVQLCSEETISNTCKVTFSGASYSTKDPVTIEVKKGGSVSWSFSLNMYSGSFTFTYDPEVTPTVSKTSAGSNYSYVYTISDVKQDIAVNLDWVFEEYGGNTITYSKNDDKIPDSTDTETKVYDTQKLNASNNWTYTWDADTIASEEYGTDKKYFVREVASDGVSTAYTTTYERYERDSEGNWNITSTGSTSDPAALEGTVPTSSDDNGAWFKVTNAEKPEEEEKTTTTSLSLKKVWKAYTEGEDSSTATEVTRTAGSVSVELWRIATVDGTAGEPTLYNTYTLSASETADNNWKLTIAELPKSVTKTTTKDGTTTSTTTAYTYYVEEVKVDDAAIADAITVTYTDSSGNTIGQDKPVSDGTIVITNTEEKEKPEEYTLPNTGGRGTLLYIVGGTALASAALLALAYRNKKKQRGGRMAH